MLLFSFQGAYVNEQAHYEPYSVQVGTLLEAKSLPSYPYVTLSNATSLEGLCNLHQSCHGTLLPCDFFSGHSIFFGCNRTYSSHTLSLSRPRLERKYVEWMVEAHSHTNN